MWGLISATASAALIPKRPRERGNFEAALSPLPQSQLNVLPLLILSRLLLLLESCLC